MMAATNRPDILDPALLRPGRFDRQVVVPLPELEERRAILEVHSKSKRLAPDVDLDVVARGTPGMSGADLSNLVNEAALFAVRPGQDEIRATDFEQARDRVLMGAAARVDGAVRPRERGHRLPRGRPRGVRRGAAHGRPRAQGDDPAHRHGARRHPAAAGRREAHLPAGLHRGQPRRRAWAAAAPRSWCSASSRPAPTTTWSAPPSWPARWCPSGACRQRVGPMAWGSSGEVFLGEDLIHTRNYSDETARVIDEEVERILREQEERCRQTLTRAPQGPRPRRPGAARARDHRRRRGHPPHHAGRRHDRAQRRRDGDAAPASTSGRASGPTPRSPRRATPTPARRPPPPPPT